MYSQFSVPVLLRSKVPPRSHLVLVLTPSKVSLREVVPWSSLTLQTRVDILCVVLVDVGRTYPSPCNRVPPTRDRTTICLLSAKGHPGCPSGVFSPTSRSTLVEGWVLTVILISNYLPVTTITYDCIVPSLQKWKRSI